MASSTKTRRPRTPAATRPFVVHVGNLLRSPGSHRREEVAGPLPGLAVTGSSVPDDGLVTVSVLLEAPPEAVVATGTVRAPWVGDCRRCLRPVRGEVVSEVREVFEETPESDDIYPLRGDQVDLEPLARDAVLLELPLAPLCAEDCAGLCPACGANRNEVDCGHVLDTRDARWAALDVLREPPSEQD